MKIIFIFEKEKGLHTYLSLSKHIFVIKYIE